MHRRKRRPSLRVCTGTPVQGRLGYLPTLFLRAGYKRTARALIALPVDLPRPLYVSSTPPRQEQERNKKKRKVKKETPTPSAAPAFAVSAQCCKKKSLTDQNCCQNIWKLLKMFSTCRWFCYMVQTNNTICFIHRFAHRHTTCV